MIPNIVLKTFVSLRFLCDERIFAIGVAGGTMDARNDAAREVDVRAGHATQGGCRIQVKNKGGGGMGKKGKEKKGICIHAAVAVCR